jgi:hypothetical protein
MRFAKVLFLVAAIWGAVIITPLYFIFDLVGKMDPPAVTHPGFYYGFAGVALAWQIGFFIIARDPARYRLMMIPAALEKIGYGGAISALFLQKRVQGADFATGLVDLVFAGLFLLAFWRSRDT